jgi:hypothetical protein
MKQYKTVDVPAKTRQVLEKTICDLCNTAIKRGSFSVDEVTVQCKTGSVYPECGRGELEGVDMCLDCFTTKLKPWLESQGCELITTEWDY